MYIYIYIFFAIGQDPSGFSAKSSSNFRLSDTEFQTRLAEQRVCENDILAVCVFEYRELSRIDAFSLAATEASNQPCVTDRHWMLGLSINGVEARAFLIFLEE